MDKHVQSSVTQSKMAAVEQHPNGLGYEAFVHVVSEIIAVVVETKSNSGERSGV